jgi:hypothetical protein
VRRDHGLDTATTARRKIADDGHQRSGEGR